MTNPRVAYILDPRFPGGTSSAVAAELAVVSTLARVEVHALSSAMFKGKTIAPQLQDQLRALDVPVIWDAAEISADIAIFHNPSCLRFQTALATRIIAHHLIVVAHENFLRPGGSEAFDVTKCMQQIERCSYTSQRTLAPISDWNRQTITDWTAQHGSLAAWTVLDRDWFNICAFEVKEPTTTPADRRGRLSRPGLEKFPSQTVLNACFPPHAQSNIILGGDVLIAEGITPPHWQVVPFRGMPVSQFFEQIDFMVYYTAPTFRESFGRVMAEAVAAGKIAISDPDTARIFGGAVIPAHPNDVESIIQGYISEPARYVRDVRTAQTRLDAFGADAFAGQIGPVLAQAGKAAA